MKNDLTGDTSQCISTFCNYPYPARIVDLWILHDMRRSMRQAYQCSFHGHCMGLADSRSHLRTEKQKYRQMVRRTYLLVVNSHGMINTNTFEVQSNIDLYNHNHVHNIILWSGILLTPIIDLAAWTISKYRIQKKSCLTYLPHTSHHPIRPDIDTQSGQAQGNTGHCSGMGLRSRSPQLHHKKIEVHPSKAWAKDSSSWYSK